MKAILVLACAGLLAAQTQRATTAYSLDTVDVNGRPLAGPETTYWKSDGDARTVERRETINGRAVTVERDEQRVVRESGGTKVIELVLHRYDPNGNPLPPEKRVITETKRADGSVAQEQVVWRGDLNGNMAITERVTSETRPSGSGTMSTIAIARPTINGSLDVVEKRDAVKTPGAGGAFENTETVWRSGQSGFYEAVRLVTAHSEQKGQVSDNTAEYEVGPNGSLELHGQVVESTTRAPDGSETSQVSYFDRHAPGYTSSADQAALQIRAQETVERIPGPGNTMTEVVSVRHPSISDPTVLGPAKKISETVCRGNCKPQP